MINVDNIRFRLVPLDEPPLEAGIPASSSEVAPGHAWDGTYTPSVTNIFWGPMSLFTSLVGLYRAKRANDQEGVLDAQLKLIGAPFNILHALALAFSAFVRVCFLIHETLAKSLEPALLLLGIPTVVLGLGLCLVEGMYETICLARSIGLTFHTGSQNDGQEAVIHNLEYFEASHLPPEAVEIDQVAGEARAQLRREAMTKRATLDRRVGFTCAEQVRTELRPILARLRDPDEVNPQAALDDAKDLLRSIDIQAKKKIIIHLVGLAAIALCAASFILAFATGGAALPVALMTIGGVFATLNYLYAKGAMDEEGWHFSFSRAIPPIGWIYNRLVGSPAPAIPA
ncbi:MAG: hypothetical protein ACHQT8_00235 [Chlamydiales bacterium]